MLTFWFALCFPGYALVRRVFPEKLAYGTLTVITFSYLCTFCLLSPLAILGFWLRLPLWTFSGGIVVAVLVAGWDLARTKAIPPRMLSDVPPGRPHVLKKRESRGEFIVSAICATAIAFDLALSAVYGGYLDGDSAFHIARIRMLLDHGLNNWDPYLYPHQFSGAYHTNIYHAFIASASQISGQSFILCWSTSLAWAKLVIAASHYYLARRVFDSSAAGWLAALASILWPYNALPIEGALRWIYLLLPHNLAPLWLLPLVIASAMDLWKKPSRAAILLAMLALVLCEVHMLYGAFLCCLLAPMVVARIGCQVFQDRGLNLVSLSLIGAMLIPVPFLWISRMGGAFGSPKLEETAFTNQHAIGKLEQSDSPEKPAWPVLRISDVLDLPFKEIARKAAEKKESGRKLLMVELDDGRMASDIRPWWQLGSQRFFLLISMLLALILRGNRNLSLIFLVSATAIIVYHPTIFTWFIAVAKVAPWAIARLDAVFAIAGYVLIPNTVTLLLGRFVDLRTVHLVALGLMLTWGLEPRESHQFEWRMIRRRTKVASLEMQRRVLQQHIPVGEVVFTDAVEAKRLTQLHNVYVLAANRMSPGLVGVQQRRLDSAVLWAGDRHPWNERERLLRDYGIRFAFSRSPAVERSLRRVFKNRLDILGLGNGVLIAKIRY